MKIIYVGHATLIVDSHACKFITDPLLTNRPARIGPKRRVKLVLEEGALEDLDFATISHGHFDHLDKRSLCMLPQPDIPIICHTELQGIVRRSCNRKAVPLKWWESTNVGDIKITAVPVLHFSARPPFQWTLDYQGYVVESDVTVFHAGDCGMSEHFKEIAKKFKIDVALLPIGAYDPPSFRKHHLAPEDALDVFELLGAKYMIPMHWGTFNLSREPFDEPPKRLLEHARKRGLEGKVKILQPGESVELDL